MRAAVVIGLVIAAAAMVWLVMRGNSHDPANRDSSHATADAGAATTHAGPGGARSKRRAGNATTPDRARPHLAADNYAELPRDPVWAPATEAKIRDKLKAILAELKADAVDVNRIDCRTKHCRFRLESADKSAFGRVFERLQEPKGFYGFARQLVVRDYHAGGDGGSARATIELGFTRPR